MASNVPSGIAGFAFLDPQTDETDGPASITLDLKDDQEPKKLNGCFVATDENLWKLLEADVKYKKIHKNTKFFIYFCYLSEIGKEQLAKSSAEIDVHRSYKESKNKQCLIESDDAFLLHNGCHVFLPVSHKALKTFKFKRFLKIISTKILPEVLELKAGKYRGLEERNHLAVFLEFQLNSTGDLLFVRDETFHKLINGPLLFSGKVVGCYCKEEDAGRMAVYMLGAQGEITFDLITKVSLNF